MRRTGLGRSMTKVVALGALAAVAVLGTVRPGVTQSDDKALGKEIDNLKAGQKQMQKDLDEIKTLLKSRPVAPAPPGEPDPSSIVLNMDPKAYFKGNKNAKVVMVDFTDYQ
jgi:protein-disulfide isomerase